MVRLAYTEICRYWLMIKKHLLVTSLFGWLNPHEPVARNRPISDQAYF